MKTNEQVDKILKKHLTYLAKAVEKLVKQDLIKEMEGVIGEVGSYPDESMSHDDKIFIATENDLKKRQHRKLKKLKEGI